MKKLTLIAALIIWGLANVGTGTANAASGPVYTGFLSNLAVGGYDPVAYFTEAKPVEGKPEFEIKHRDVNWRFSSAENLAKFKADPDKYAPQYGGHCAWAVSQGYTYKGDPNHWRIVDGRLFLNYNAEVQKSWAADLEKWIAAGDKNWPKVAE